MTRKTPLMREVERRKRARLETLIPELINKHGQKEAARRLNLPPGTVSRWLLKLGIQTRYIALRPGEQLVIKQAS